MQVYIQAKSKVEVNQKLAEGKTVTATEYDMFNTLTHNFNELPEGTTVKIFEKYVGGNPFAKSYGVVKGGKIR